MKKENAVVILSGGMDSTTLLYDVINQGFNVKALTFNYNQRHSKEIDYAIKTCKKLGVEQKIIDLKILGEIAPSALTSGNIDVPHGHYEEENMKQTVVPNRNMVLISLAAAYAIGQKYNHLFYGAHGGDHAIYPDCRTEFIEKMGEVLKIADWIKLELHAPYLNKDKGDIAILGKQLGVDYSLTWTCYEGLEEACGACGSCVERLEAFKKIGLQDPIKYKGGK